MKIKLLVLPTLFLLFSAELFAGEIIIATVAQVKNHVITTREVKIQYVIDRALKRAPYFRTKREPVEQLIREWLLYFEAMDFYSNRLMSDKVTQTMNELAQWLPKVDGWKELQVSNSELRKFVAAKLEADRLFDFKQKASTLPVSESEIESEYKQNRVRYGTQPLKEVREKIRSQKTRESLERRLSNWFAVLEKKYNVQRFVEYNANP